MAAIPTFSRFSKEDFKNLPDADKLLSSLNGFMGAVVAALSNRLTFRENLSSQTLEIVLLDDPSNYPIRFKWNLPTKPTDLWITDIQAIDGTEPTASGCLWTYDELGLAVTTVFGLTAGSKYRIRFKALGE
jgi:hypothetical protein